MAAVATAREAARHRTLCGNVRQAYHRFNGAAPNQEWRDQRGQARVWPTCQQNSSLFSRAPIQKFSSAARRQARRRRRKISGTSPTCRFLDEIRPSRAPACSPCGPAPAASRAACSQRSTRATASNIQPAPLKRTQRSVLRSAPRQARSANGDGATRAGRCREGSPA